MVIRLNLDAQLGWLGGCRDWTDVFGTRLDPPTLEKHISLSLPEPRLKVQTDWAPLWRRAAAGRIDGGEVQERSRAAPCGKAAQGKDPPLKRAKTQANSDDIEESTLLFQLQGPPVSHNSIPQQPRNRPAVQVAQLGPPNSGGYNGLALVPGASVPAASIVPQASGYNSAVPPHGSFVTPAVTLPMPSPSGVAPASGHNFVAPTYGTCMAAAGTLPAPSSSDSGPPCKPRARILPPSMTASIPRTHGGKLEQGQCSNLNQLEYTGSSTMAMAKDLTRSSNLNEFQYTGSSTKALVEDLKKWRGEYAASIGKKSFQILSNAAAEAIAVALPRTEQDLLAVEGVSQAKVKELGQHILERCRRFVPQYNRPQPTQPASASTMLTPQWQVPPQKRARKENAAAMLDAPVIQAQQVIDIGMLTMEQRDAASRALAGENVFISGAAGTGKSFLMRYLIQELEKKHSGGVAITAPTGIAAVNIGGTTVHSFAGIGLGMPPGMDVISPHRFLLSRVRKSAATAARWCETKALIIDEVSMLEPELFQLLDFVGCEVRSRRHQGFGGINLLFCGDFLQLPPVDSSNADAKFTFCFETPTWKKCGLHKGTIILTQSVRQAGDPAFVKLLNEVRAGQFSQRVAQELSRCSVRPRPTDIIPTKLYCTNRDVDVENESRLAELPGVLRVFKSDDTYIAKGARGSGDSEKKKLAEMLGKRVPQELRLKVNAQVILLRRLQNHGLVNGSRGVVTNFTSTGVEVRFDNGKQVTVERDLSRQFGAHGEFRRSQIPLRLGWALTIHKAQGMTLSRAEVQLSNTFMPGQAYVALSRVTGLDGLWILGGSRVSQQNIQAHPSALRFYGLVS